MAEETPRQNWSDPAQRDKITSFVAAPNSRDTDNEQQTPLAPGEFRPGVFKRIDQYPSAQILYAALMPFTARIVWSDDGVNPLPAPFTGSVLPQRVTNGFNVAYHVITGNALAAWYKLDITNGLIPQFLYPGFISLNWLINTPYNGAFVFMDESLGLLTKFLATRSVIMGLKPDGLPGNVSIDQLGALQVGSLQIKDAGNSFNAPGSAMPTVAAPWIGVPYLTRNSGVVGTTFSVVGTPGKSGTAIFNYAPTTNQTPASVPIRVPLHIMDLGNPLLVPLQNVEDYFWLEFVPDDNTGTELHIATLHHKQMPPPLSRFLSQTITDNEATQSQRSFLSARKADGTWPPVSFGQQLRAGSLPMALDTETVAKLEEMRALLAAPSGAIALDAATMAALESFYTPGMTTLEAIRLLLASPAPVALDMATLAALEAITVSGFPADYPNAAALAKLEQVRALLAAPLSVSLPAGAATEATLAAVLAALAPGSYLRKTTTGATLVKSGPGTLKRIINAGLGGVVTLTLYDSLTASGTIIGTLKTVTNVSAVWELGLKFNTGLTISTSATTDVSVVYS